MLPLARVLLALSMTINSFGAVTTESTHKINAPVIEFTGNKLFDNLAKALGASSKEDLWTLAYFLDNPDQLEYGKFITISSQKYRMDLILTDIIDQVINGFPGVNNYLELHKAINYLPVTNFPKFSETLVALSQKNDEDGWTMQRIINSLYVQVYRADGTAVESGMVRSLFRHNERAAQAMYNDYVKDAEGVALLRALEQDRLDYLSPMLTVAKLEDKWIKGEVENDRANFYEKYVTVLSKVESETSNPDLMVINSSNQWATDAVKFKIYQSINNSEDYQKLSNRRAAEGWFNALMARSDKRNLLAYLSGRLFETNHISIPIEIIDGTPHVMLTPSFLYSNREVIEPILKEYNHKYSATETRDEQEVYAIRVWVKQNFEDVTAKGLQYSKRFAPMAEIVEKYDQLVAAFPNRPWEKSDVLYDKYGNPVLVGHWAKNIFRKYIKDPAKAAIRTENIIPFAAGIGVGIGTANPFAAAVTMSGLKNFIEVLKYDHSLKQAAVDMVSDTAVAAIPGVGMLGGEFANAAFFGMARGAFLAYVNGQPVIPSMAIGAAVDVTERALPAAVAYPNFGKSAGGIVAGVAHEIAYDGVKYMSISALTELVTTGNERKIADAAERGLLVGTSAGVFKIILVGPRLEPYNLSQKELDKLYKKYKPYHAAKMTPDEIRRIPRRDQRFGIIPLVRNVVSPSDKNRSFVVFDGSATISKRDQNRPDQIKHELALHGGQWKKEGIFGMFAKYIVGGGDGWEDYH